MSIAILYLTFLTLGVICVVEAYLHIRFNLFLRKTSATTTFDSVKQGDDGGAGLVDGGFPYVDELANVLRVSRQALFQSRKIGVELVIPEHIRTQLIERHGDEAKEWLDEIDGNVKP